MKIKNIDKYRLSKTDHKFSLDRIDPNDKTPGLYKDDEKEMSSKLHEKLLDLQRLLYAGHEHKVLIVLQGMDTSGKDGVIQHVFEGVNPQGVEVASFKVPSQEESDHDYLWRVHHRVPAKGKMVIFNRSHYEDVLITRVHRLVAPEVWKNRYHQINEFERMLAEEGTLILKFFLHISKNEQKARLEERLKDPDHRWKFNPADLKERKLWPQYMSAYQEAIGKTAAAWAPWYVIPSNRKWVRNFLVLSVIVEHLKELRMKYPKKEQ